MKLPLKRLAVNALIAALYLDLTLVTASFAYRDIQFRIAEIFVLLAFFRKDYLIGVTIGCFLANLFGPLGIVDAVFGSLATLASGLLIAYSKNLFVATLYPVVINGLVVGAELYFLEGLPFWLSALLVAIGEFVVVSLIGYIVINKLRTNEHFMKMIDANQNTSLGVVK
ncbi:MAG: QueT transporter family protein [Bacilli bacterium]|jgi:uncharacterized membrane protein